MQKTNMNVAASTTHRKVQKSTTLNRRYVRQPNDNLSMSSSMPGLSMQQKTIADTSARVAQTPVTVSTTNTNTEAFNPSPIHSVAIARMKQRQSQSTQQMNSAVSAKELKERAIKKALATASSPMEEKQTKKEQPKKNGKMYFGFGRVMLALACAAATAFAIVYFVDSNMPDISLKVAAMQTGINASYPSYIPRDFNVSSITSENGKITMEFANNTTGDAFTLVEESSSWDSNALLTNYVKEEFGANYSTVKEQGITMYMTTDRAAWVNGGVVYKLSVTSGELTNKQIKSIAVSL